MYLIKNHVNTIALTLTEKAIANDSEWLIKLTNDVTGQSKIFAVEDISEFQERANIFLIEENDTEDLRNGIVSLSPSGQWTYRVYEMAPSSPRNLETEYSLGEVKSGRALVEDLTENEKNNFDEDDQINNQVFDEP